MKGELRTCGGITYILYRKNIKNMYIRISRDGEVRVSANRRISLGRIEDFILQNAKKVTAQLARLSCVTPEKDIDEEKCRMLFEEISMKFYPLFSRYTGGKPPEIKLKSLRAAWGICHTRDNYISLNKRLYLKPIEAVEYVILHEYTHFVHPNHQKEFYAHIKSIMPDYKERKKLLKQ
ncbi:MAG: M48 family metallopeptidase [Ruminococcaceae bacterium]|nr:M48 family metallopeptidase [Oscillospiraceae bacterium]